MPVSWVWSVEPRESCEKILQGSQDPKYGEDLWQNTQCRGWPMLKQEPLAVEISMWHISRHVDCHICELNTKPQSIEAFRPWHCSTWNVYCIQSCARQWPSLKARPGEIGKWHGKGYLPGPIQGCLMNHPIHPSNSLHCPISIPFDFISTMSKELAEENRFKFQLLFEGCCLTADTPPIPTFRQLTVYLRSLWASVVFCHVIGGCSKSHARNAAKPWASFCTWNRLKRTKRPKQIS